MVVERTLLQERLLNIVSRFGDRKILVVGDLIADQFIYGAIDRVSREAPVFILRHEQTQTVPGGAANCAMNLAALGASVAVVGVVGSDEAGKTIIKRLNEAGADTTQVVSLDDTRTTTKVRILAGQLHSTRQQVIRIDYDAELGRPSSVSQRLRAAVTDHAKNVDAIIISDYNYGVVDEEMVTAARDSALPRKLPVVADSRFRLINFPGLTSATPNEDEVEHLLARRITDLSDLESAAEHLRETLGYRALLVTRGGHGMMLLEEGAPALHINAVGAQEPVDVTGAGDTVIAVYALALASDSSFSDAARLANYAGGLVIMKRGTASITREELEHSVIHSELS